jgi:twitching motility two-component system response regulator PilH
MPGMNGFQATSELARNSETASIPVVMVTTKGEETDKIWGMRQGAVDYLVKPVTEAQLVEKVRAARAG